MLKLKAIKFAHSIKVGNEEVYFASSDRFEIYFDPLLMLVHIRSLRKPEFVVSANHMGAAYMEFELNPYKEIDAFNKIIKVETNEQAKAPDTAPAKPNTKGSKGPKRGAKASAVASPVT